jgi:hypothetical protein
MTVYRDAAPLPRKPCKPSCVACGGRGHFVLANGTILECRFCPTSPETKVEPTNG